MLAKAPAVCKASCKATLDVCLAYLHAARLQRALTNPQCVLIALTWESGSWRSACSFMFCQTAHSVLSHMSAEEMSERGEAPGVSQKAPRRIKPCVLMFDRGLNMRRE